MQLLKNELTNLGEWDSNTQATIHSLNAEQTVNPAAAQNYPLLTRISECSNFLNVMLGGVRGQPQLPLNSRAQILNKLNRATERS